MSRHWWLLFLVGTLSLTAGVGAADTDKPPKGVRVLILSGVPETHHDYKNQCPNMAGALRGQGHEVVLRDKTLVEEGDAKKFDVVVLMSERWRGDEKNRQALLDMVRGGTGLVVVHMAYVPCVEALGGKASRNGKTGDLKVEVVDRQHPVTAGMRDFTAGPNDELYAGVNLTAEDVHVLARGQDASGTWEPVAWVRPFGRGRVFYTSLGHSTESQKNPAFLKLVAGAVRWAGAPARAPAEADEGGVTRIGLLPPRPGNPRNSEGAFVRLKDGRILFVYTHFTGGGGDDAAAHLAARSSGDGGTTWTSEDMTVLPNEAGMNVMSVSLLQLPNGAIALFYLRKNSLEDCRPYLRLSTDEARTWGEPILCAPAGGYYVVNNDRAVQLKSGRLVVPAARHNVPGGKWTARGVALCFLSDDSGKTWRKSKGELHGPEGSQTGLQEPGVVELKDGRLLMLCRTDLGCQYLSYSADGGNTWSPAEPTDIKSPVSPASLKRIPRTSDLLLVWNDHSKVDAARRGKRTPLTAAVSRDDGKTWGKGKALEDDPDGWYCYTAIGFVGDRVLLGHCAGNRKTGGLNRTQITVFTLDWLYR
jgi:type 1 glutamine amidotransferase